MEHTPENFGRMHGTMLFLERNTRDTTPMPLSRKQVHDVLIRMMEQMGMEPLED